MSADALLQVGGGFALLLLGFFGRFLSDLAARLRTTEASRASAEEVAELRNRVAVLEREYVTRTELDEVSRRFAEAVDHLGQRLTLMVQEENAQLRQLLQPRKRRSRRRPPDN